MRYTELSAMAGKALERRLDMFLQILPQATLMALSAAVGWLGGKIKGAAKERDEREKRMMEERDAMRAIVRLLLYYRLKDLFTEYAVKCEPITSAEKHEVEEVYTHYHKLGGNGEGSRMYNEIMRLKVNG